MYREKTKWERTLIDAIQSMRKLCDVGICKNVALGLAAYKFLSDSHPKLKRDWSFPLILNQARDGFLETDDLAQVLEGTSLAIPRCNGIFDDIKEQLQELAPSEDKRKDTVKGITEALAPFDFSKMNPTERGISYARQIEALSSNRKTSISITPANVSELIACMITIGKQDVKTFSIYDPTMGTASLLLKTGIALSEETTVSYYGQEINHQVICIARRNFLMHGIAPETVHLKEGDTLVEDAFIHQTGDTSYDAVVMNPPYSAHWSADPNLIYDPRFADVGLLPPRTHADNAFLLHGLHHLKDDGIMVILLPHGVLFRGGTDGKIRQYLIDRGNIDAIIGLPANLFYGIKIPFALLILKKQRRNHDILIIDASKEYEQNGRQNYLTKNNIQRILNAYRHRAEVSRFCHLAALDEIRANDYNLNIPRYVDTFEPAPECDIMQLTKNLSIRNEQMIKNKVELSRAIKQLKPLDKDTSQAIQALLNLLK